MLQPTKKNIRLPYVLKISLSKVKKGTVINFPKDLLHKKNEGIEITFIK